MQSAEPMLMGSPSSPGAHGQSQYLPAYLMGEPAPMATSPQRLWSSSTMSSSPPKASFNRSLSFMSPTGQGPTSPFGQTPRSEARTRDMIGGRGKDKPGAPPVSGLLEHIASPVSTPDRKMDSMNQSRIQSAQFGTPFSTPCPATPGPQQTPDLHTSSIFSPSASQTSHMYTPHKKTPPSPAQVDPFYTQGESIRPDDELDDTWVTIFGFPAAAASFVLQQFSQYGNILRHVVATDGNWLHIKYQSRLQAKKALSKNGKVFGSSIMVGVMPCIDKTVMEQYREGHCNESIIGTPTQPVQTLGNTSMQKHTPIRPLTAAYRAAHSDHEVIQQGNTPQKSTNFISKAMEYMFGW